MTTPEIVGFLPFRGEATAAGGSSARRGFEEALQHAKNAEITRIAAVAERLLRCFGAAIAVGFLYYEILGRPPQRAECAGLAKRLERGASTTASIAAELLALARAEATRAAQPR
jgi:hypothetical protein